MFIDDREIGKAFPPYVIAEACNNFNNDFDMACDMVKAAKIAGADAIKFQLRFHEDRLNVSQHEQLKELCDKNGITYLCTAFEKRGVDVLQRMGLPAFKIGSGQNKDFGFVEYVCKRRKPVLFSTGGLDSDDVWNLACGLSEYDVTFLHCVSEYPTPYKHVNLKSLFTMPGDCYGFSDHTPTIYTALGAVALGASIIEKHVTFDKTMRGPDQSSSITFEQLAELVLASQVVHQARGKNRKEVYKAELEKLGR